MSSPGISAFWLTLSRDELLQTHAVFPKEQKNGKLINQIVPAQVVKRYYSIPPLVYALPFFIIVVIIMSFQKCAPHRHSHLKRLTTEG